MAAELLVPEVPALTAEMAAWFWCAGEDDLLSIGGADGPTAGPAGLTAVAMPVVILILVLLSADCEEDEAAAGVGGSGGCSD